MTDASKQGAVPDAVEMEVEGCGEVNEIDELDVLPQYCEEVFGKGVCITEPEAEGNNAMDWSDIELETGEMYVGHNNCEEVAGQVFDMIGLEPEWEWRNVELESGEVYVGQNSYEELAGKVLDTIGLKADMNYDMEWSDVELETGEVFVGQNSYVEVAGKVLDTTGLEANVNYDMEWDWT